MPSHRVTGKPLCRDLWICGTRPDLSPTGKTSCIGRLLFRGCGVSGKTSARKAAFDAVIGNPPWDRIKLQEVEWFATRSPELALAPTAAARRTGIQRLRDQGAPLAAEFDAAKARADNLGRMVRTSGHYPLLGGGDINLYSLFVERAMDLIKPDGFVGLLTPSGIYADKTAARFFKSVSTKGRVGSLFDFENRRLGTNLPPFFQGRPRLHDSNSAPSSLVVRSGGLTRPSAPSSCTIPRPSKTRTAVSRWLLWISPG